MQLLLTTRVADPDPAHVLAGFTEELFRALAPPFPRLRVRRFDGCEVGDVVQVDLDWGFGHQPWTSHITENGTLPGGGVYFVDEASAPDLPWPFRAWRHRHLLTPAPGGGTNITEDLTWTTGARWFDPLTRPALWALLAYRRPIYRRWFGTPAA